MKLTKTELMAAPPGVPIHSLTKAQKTMIEDGAPPVCVTMTQEERAEVWRRNPPKPMPSTLKIETKDPATVKFIQEMEEQKKLKTKARISKMLARKENHTGKVWDTRICRWVDETEKTKMITITTNTRGSTQMPAKKDYADMSATELVDAYNKISGKDPIKKFRDRPTALARLAAAETAKANAAKKQPTAVSGTKKVPEKKAGSSNKLAAEFNARVGTNREKVIIALDESFKKQIPLNTLLKAVYGSQNQENKGALLMVISGVPIMIKKYSLPYELKKEKVDGEVTFGLYPK